MTRVRLLRKLALTMNGVDVSGLQVGDLMELPDDRAQMMIELGWAELVLDPNALRHPLTRRPPGNDIPSE